VCRQCGYEEREGTFFAVGGSSEDGEDEAVREAQVARTREHAQGWRWLSNTMMLGTLTFRSALFSQERGLYEHGGRTMHRVR
jgi:hypothetical protein